MAAYNDNYVDCYSPFDPRYCLVTVVIQSGQSESEPIDTRGYAVVGLTMPSQWTPARIGWKRSHDGINWGGLVRDNGGSAILTVADANYDIAFPQDQMVLGRYIRLCSVDASGNAVNQAGNRQISVLMRRMFS